MQQRALYFIAFALASAIPVPGTPPAGTTSAVGGSTKKSHGVHGGSSPFSAFTKSLPQEKKKPFMELMKRLRAAKNDTSSTSKEDKKKAQMGLDAEIHKLLGGEYKRYRSVTASVKAEHAAKKATATTGMRVVGGTVVKPPPPPGSSGASPTGTKKKKAGGAMGPTGTTLKTKKVKPASTTTIG